MLIKYCEGLVPHWLLRFGQCCPKSRPTLNGISHLDSNEHHLRIDSQRRSCHSRLLKPTQLVSSYPLRKDQKRFPRRSLLGGALRVVLCWQGHVPWGTSQQWSRHFFPRHMGCDLVSGLKKSLLGCQPLFSFFVLAMYFDAEAGGAFGVIV